MPICLLGLSCWQTYPDLSHPTCVIFLHKCTVRLVDPLAVPPLPSPFKAKVSFTLSSPVDTWKREIARAEGKLF